MGNSKSTTLTDELLEEYDSLTYLTKSDILYIYRKFRSISPVEIDEDIHYRIQKSFVMDKFPILKYNPFRDRIFRVFSSHKDEHFSFEDMLDLCSVMDDECPDKVKAAWAFKIFDLNEDNQIGKDDIANIIDRLTYIRNAESKSIDDESKAKIADVILGEMDLTNVGSMGLAEFTHAMSKIPEFADAFYFKL